MPTPANTPDLRLLVSSQDEPRVWQAGAPRPPILVVWTGEGSADSEAVIRAARHRPLVFLVAPEQAPGRDELAQKLVAVAWQCQVLDAGALPAESLPEQLSQPAWKPLLMVM